MLALVAIVAALAHPAAPARNGLVAFDRCCGLASTGIYTIRQNGTGQRRIFRPLADDAPLTPAWSPNGKQIAYVPGSPTGGLWMMNANGTGRHRIVRGNGDPLFPSWSTDGTKIVFADVPHRGSRFHDLYVVRANGTGLRRLTAAPADETAPAWAPNDRSILYARGRDIWTMRTDGTRQRLLLHNGHSPSWSPGATHIAFIRTGNPWIANASGTHAIRVVGAPQPQISVAWSPDGRWLATAPIDRGNILLIRTNGSQTTPLTNAAGFFNSSPAWQRLR